MKNCVIVGTDFRDRPKEHELSAAILIANYFKTNVIVDLRRIKMPQSKALSNIDYYFSSHRSQIKHLIVITKSEEILEIL